MYNNSIECEIDDNVDSPRIIFSQKPPEKTLAHRRAGIKHDTHTHPQTQTNSVSASLHLSTCDRKQ